MIPFVISVGVIVLGLAFWTVALLVWVGRIHRYRDQTQADINLEWLRLSEAKQELRDRAAEVALFARLAVEMDLPYNDDDTIQR